MSLSRFDQIIQQAASGIIRWQPIYWMQETNPVAFGSSGSTGIQVGMRAGYSKAMPGSLPSGVTAFVPVSIGLALSSTTAYQWIVGVAYNMGNLNIGTNVFTDGVAMPSVTEAGASVTARGFGIMEVTTVLNSAPGSITTTYKDQDGNTAEATAAQTLPASGPVGCSGFINLNSGDYAVTDITTAAQSGGTTPSGVITFWGVRPIAMGCGSMSGAGNFGEIANILSSAPVLVGLGISEQIAAFAFSGSGVTGAWHGDIVLVGDT